MSSAVSWFLLLSLFMIISYFAVYVNIFSQYYHRYLHDKLEFDILTIILVYSAKTDNQFSVMSLSNKTFKSFFELVRAFSRRINVSNTNAFVWLG